MKLIRILDRNYSDFISIHAVRKSTVMRSGNQTTIQCNFYYYYYYRRKEKLTFLLLHALGKPQYVKNKYRPTVKLKSPADRDLQKAD